MCFLTPASSYIIEVTRGDDYVLTTRVFRHDIIILVITKIMFEFLLTN